jgi:hypothetical protein
MCYISSIQFCSLDCQYDDVGGHAELLLLLINKRFSSLELKHLLACEELSEFDHPVLLIKCCGRVVSMSGMMT